MRAANKRKSIIDLTFLQHVQLRIFGQAYVGHRIAKGWKAPLPFYAFKCPVHGVVEDYPHGYNGRLDCPRCQRGDELLRMFIER